MADTVVNFTRNKDLLGGDAAVGLAVSAPKDPALARALAANKPFPNRAIEIGDVALTGAAGKDVVFGKGRGKVVFKGQGSAFAGLGLYPDGKEVMRRLGLGASFAKGIELPGDPEKHFHVMRWGYDAQASAKGSMALGGGITPTFGAEGKRERLFAVVRMLDRTKGSRDALREVANSWVLPKQVDGIGDLRPGTWVITEVDGSVGLSLGARYGLDFNWVREAELGGLTGEIGLRIQLGVEVALGFNTSGSYALMLARETGAKKIRVRLFKLSRKGWDFALNAAAKVEPKTKSFLPGTFEDFAAAVFGLNSAQLMDDLATLRKWTDPDTPLPELLAGAGSDYAKKLVKDLTGIDPEQQFAKAKQRVTDLLDRWERLPHEVSTRLWKLLPENAKLDEVRKVAGRIQDIQADDEAAREVLLAELLQDVDFADSPAGEWLEAAVLARGDDLLKALLSSSAFKRLQGVAAQTTEILDGSKVEETLTRFHAWIDERLGLDRLETVVDETSFDDLDAWLKGRLAGFLGTNVAALRLDEIGTIRKTITLILDKKDAFYEKALEALNRKYQFTFAAVYQKATERSALLDIDLDFNKGDLGKWLLAAVNGDFDRIMTEKVPGVSLNVAALSHGVRRQSHVSIDVPFYKADLDHINKALVKVTAVDEEDGRLLIYDPEFQDEVDARNKRNSRLTIAGSLKVDLNTVRVRSADGLDYSYSFRQATPDMRRQALDYQLQPYVETYFPTHFPVGEGSFESWIGDLDRTIDDIESNGTDYFGNTLISLDLALSQEVAASWLKAPPRKSDPIYREMSRRLQKEMRRTLGFYYFQNPKKYRKLKPAASLLAYSAIPVSTAVSLSNDKLTLNRKTGDIFWDWRDPEVLEAMLFNRTTQARLIAELQKIHRRLRGEPGMGSTLEFYEPTEANFRRIVADAQTGGRPFLDGLLFTEAQMVRAARKAGLAMARYQKKKTSKPSQAAEALAEFGSEITVTFNQKLKGFFDRGAVRPLGTQLFIAAAHAINPGLRGYRRAAALELRVLRSDAVFPPEGFPNFPPPREEDTLVAQRLVSS